MTVSSLNWLEQWHRFLLQHNERRLVILAGNDKTQNEAAVAISEFCQLHGRDLLLWGKALGDLNSVNSNFRHQLGREYDVVMFNDEHFHADAFAALSGTIKAGGFFVWIQTESQQKSPDFFIERLLRQVNNTKDVLNFAQELPIATHDASQHCVKQSFAAFEYNASNHEQLKAIKNIIKVASGRAHRPLVLTADRGRGKSSALGLAAGYLLKRKKSPYKVVVCAPVRGSLEVFFKHAAEQCLAGELDGNKLNLGGNTIEFYPIDKLLQELPDINLLIVDEAAAIPLHLLNRLVKLYPRIVFSTTQHGYEGAGRGFATKFKQTLEKLTPNYRKLHLEQPIRWRSGDPLEQFVFSAFKLNASEISVEKQHEPYHFESLSKKALFEDESLLSQVFAILVSAHYQTSPTDLKLILTNPKSHIFVLKQGATVVAVSLVIEEGMASDTDIQLMFENKRQLRNQFIPQYLYRHCFFEQAFDYKYWRISRIAVCQTLQNQGLGSLLLDKLQLEAKQRQVDFVATSFAANAQVVNFWQQSAFILVDLGLNKDKASGEYSALLLKAISREQQATVDQLHSQIVRSFWYKLSTSHRDVSTELALELVCGFASDMLPVTEPIDEKAISALVLGQAQLAQCAFSVQVWLAYQVKKVKLSLDISIKTAFGEYTIVQGLSLLIAKYWLCRHDKLLLQEFGLTGVKQLNYLLIETVKLLMKIEA